MNARWEEAIIFLRQGSPVFRCPAINAQTAGRRDTAISKQHNAQNAENIPML